MEAARVAALRGHRVSLYEQQDALGGLVRQAAVPEFKKDLRRLLAWYERQIDQAGVNVLLNREVSAGAFDSLSPDVTILAAGARPIVPELPGVEQDSVVTAVELLKGKIQTGPRVAIIGGGLAGCEIAIWLAQQGREVCLVEMLPALMTGGAPVPMQVNMMTLNLLKKHQVRIQTSSALQQITAEGIKLLHQDRRASRMAADTIVLALGMTPDTHLAEQLAQTGQRVYCVGDCRQPRNIMRAVWDAYEIARWL
jgi:2-enoate reductase